MAEQDGAAGTSALGTSIRAHLDWAVTRLAPSGRGDVELARGETGSGPVPDPPPLARFEAEVLLAHCLERPRTFLYAHAEAPVDARVAAAFAGAIERRRLGVPVAYLTGRREFWSMSLEVSPDTLVPRPQTETLVETALDVLDGKAGGLCADLGTGSGAIALALAGELESVRIVATDLSPAALAVAARNRRRFERENVSLLRARWMSGFVDERFDAVVSNPPYVAADDPHLARGDVAHEPRRALASGRDGLDDLRRIVSQAPRCLRAGGWLILEHGYNQGAPVRALLAAAGLGAIRTVCDLEGQERVTRARKD